MTRFTSTPIKIALAGAFLFSTVAYAGIGQNIGGGISTFDNGISFDGTGGFTPPVGCASDGKFDLSNTCNDIYLLTGSL